MEYVFNEYAAKLHYFNHSQGKTIRTKFLLMIPLLLFGLVGIMFCYMALFRSGVPIWFALIGLVALYFSSYAFQYVKLDDEGIKIFSTNKHGLIRYKYLTWEEAAGAYFSEDSIKLKSIVCIQTTDGEDELINSGALNIRPAQLYNLIMAYMANSQMDDFDWLLVMRGPGESESMTKSVLWTIFIGFISFLGSLAFINTIVKNFYSGYYNYNDASLTHYLIMNADINGAIILALLIGYKYFVFRRENK